MKLKCPDCGTQYESGKFCQECGSKLQEVVPELVCPSCGFKAKSGKFCPECGTKLSDEASVTVTENCVEEPAVERKFNEKDERFAKYYDKKGFPRDIPKEERDVAIEELTLYVEQGIPEAKMLLACIISNDNQVKAEKLVKEASESGDRIAYYLLGTFYLFGGKTIGQDYDEAEKRLLGGYEEFNDSKLAAGLAFLYLHSDKKRDYQKALKFASIAADDDEELGYLALGHIYENGWGIEQNKEFALENYKMAAAHGNETAMNQMGFILMGGDTFEANPKQAFYWFNEAAQKADEIGLFNVGCCYRDGFGVERDIEKAVDCFKKSAEKGYPDAMFELGKYYQSVLVDSTKSRSWYLKAAEEGHTESMINLGLIYELGNGVEKDTQKAYNYYRIAAENGNPQGMKNLAVLLFNGNGCVQDKGKAFYWCMEAAKFNHPEALNFIGYMYGTGNGVAQDWEKAFKYYHHSASLGNSVAMWNVAIRYLNGEGCEKNEDFAYEWMEKSAEKGYQPAIDWLEENGKEEENDDIYEESDEEEDYDQGEDEYYEEEDYDNQDYADDINGANLNFEIPTAFPAAEIQNVYFSTDGDKNITVNIDFTVQNMNGKWIDVGVDWYVNNHFKVGNGDRSLITFDDAKFTGFHLTVNDVFYDYSLDLNVKGDNIIKVVIFIGERDHTGKFSNNIYANETYEISVYSKYHLFGKNEIIFR